MSLKLNRSTWKRVKLGDIASASKEKVDPVGGSVDRYVAGEHMDSDDLKIHRWGSIGDIELGPAFHRRFRPGQVLYGSRRTYLRKVAVADFDGVCANTTFVVTTKNPEVLLQEFLPFVMTAEPFHAFAIAESKGSVNPYVNWTDIEQYEFDLPTIDEQKRLADLLWRIESHSESIKFVSSSLSLNYDYWIEKRLSDYDSVAMGSFVTLQNGRPVPSELYGMGDFNLLRPGDMKRNGEICWSDNSVMIPKDFAESNAAWVLSPGDVVINMTAQSLEDRFLGRVCRMHEEALLNQRIGRLTVHPGCLLEYMYLALRSPSFAAWVAQRSEGSKVKHMHWRHISDYPLPLPPESEQAMIVSEASLWTEAESRALDELRSLDNLRKTIMMQIFGGY